MWAVVLLFVSATALWCKENKDDWPQGRSCPNSLSCAFLLRHTWYWRPILKNNDRDPTLHFVCGHEHDRNDYWPSHYPGFAETEQETRIMEAVPPMPQEPRLDPKDHPPAFLGLIELGEENAPLVSIHKHKNYKGWELVRKNHAVVFCFTDDCNSRALKPGFNWTSVTWVRVASMAERLDAVTGTLCAGPEGPSWPAVPALEVPAANLSTFATLLYCPGVKCCGVTAYRDGTVTDRHCPDRCLSFPPGGHGWNCSGRQCTCSNHPPTNLSQPCNLLSVIPVRMMQAAEVLSFLLPGSLVSMVVSLLVAAAALRLRIILRVLRRDDEGMLDLETMLRERSMDVAWIPAWCRKRGVKAAEVKEVDKAVKAVANNAYAYMAPGGVIKYGTGESIYY